MSRYFGLIFVCALCAGCGGNPFDAVSAAELDGSPASQCRLDVTTQVKATQVKATEVKATSVVQTYSTFACEGSPIE